jgi:hypothetical protein
METLKASDGLTEALAEACRIDPSDIRHVVLNFNDSCVWRGWSTAAVITHSGEHIEVDEATTERIHAEYQIKAGPAGREVIIDGGGRSDITGQDGAVIGAAETDDDYYISLIRIPRLLC